MQNNPGYVRIMLVLCLFAISTSIGVAGPNEWTNDGGPYGGHVYALTMDPTNQDILYAGTCCSGGGYLWHDGIYKTTNSGETWELIGLFGAGIKEIVIDPTDENIIYAGTTEKLWQSTDAGITWVQKPTISSVVYDITIDPYDHQILYIGTPFSNAACQKSTDGGETWFDSGMPNTYLYSVLCDPDDPNVVYCGGESYTINPGFYKSTDGGQTWTQMTNGFPNVAPTEIVADPNNPDIIYAATNDYYLGDGIYKSTDNGESWTQIGLGDKYCWAVAIDPANSNNVYAGTYNGLYKSTNAGNNWSGPFISSEVSIEEIEVKNNIVFAGERGSGVYKSVDGGITWAKSDSCMTSGDFRAVVVNPDNPNEIFAAGWRYGIHKSVNSGKTWEYLTVNPVLDYAAGLCMTYEPGNSQVIYLGTSGDYIWKTTDGGITWQQKSSGLDAYSIKSIAITPSNPEIVYCSSVYGGELIYKSTNGGDNWFSSVTGLSGNRASIVIVDPVNPDIVYAGLNTGVFKSTNSGDLWTATPLTNSIVSLVAVMVDTNTIIYAGTQFEGVYKSTDQGESWIQSGLPNLYVATLVIDPNHPDTLYAGLWSYSTTSGGVRISEDGGLTWSTMNTGMGSADVRCLAVDPVDTRNLYAATMGGSVYRYTKTTGVVEETALSCQTNGVGLMQICPNPFSQSTIISYQLPRLKSRISLKIYNTAGRLIRQFCNSTILPSNQIVWDGRDEQGKEVESGVYFCQIAGDDFIRTVKMILVK